MMRRRLRVAFAAAAVLGGAAPLAAQSIPVTVGGQTSSLVGVSFDLPVQFDLSARSERLGSFAFRLRWNPLVLQYVADANGTFGGVTINRDSIDNGVIFVSGANPAGVGGKSTATVVTFLPLLASGDTLQLQVSEAYAAATFADLLPAIATSNRIYCPARGRWGDIDGDGVANSRDALMALSSSVGLDVPGVDLTLGDVDGN